MGLRTWKNYMQQPKKISQNYKMIPTSWPSTPYYKSTTYPTCFIPPSCVIAMQWTWHSWYKRQSNKCGSVGNNEIINLDLGSGVGPWVSNPCVLQDTCHIYWFHPPKQPGKNKECRNEIELPTNLTVLPWPTNTELRANRHRFGTQP